MSRARTVSVLAFLVSFGFLAAFPEPIFARTAPGGGPQNSRSTSLPRTALTSSSAARAYGSLPLSFEANEGQTDSRVKYLSHGSGYTLFLTRQGAVFVRQQNCHDSSFLQRLTPSARKQMATRKIGRALLRMNQRCESRVVRIAIDGASDARLEALSELPGKRNYFIGADRNKWHLGIPTYRRVRYSGIYPGIDLVYYGNQRRLEFDFVVSPGSDPRTIALKFDGEQRLSVTRGGNVRVGSREDAFVLRRPSIYQIESGRKREVQGGYVSLGRGRVGLQVAAYNRTEPLIIDPVVAYSTYLGGSSGGDADGIAVDASGHAYIAGATASVDFPVVNGYQTTSTASFSAFVSELDANGKRLLYSTYLGGSGETYGQGIAIDTNGNAYVTGYTFAADFPIVGGFQTTNNNAIYGNAFVAKLDTNQIGTSSLVYSTYVGGGGNSNSATLGVSDAAFGIAADSSGRAYVTGITTSDTSVTPFPTTASAYQSTLNSPNGNAFLSVVDTTQAGAASLIYSTYLGGDGAGSFVGDCGVGVAVDAAANAYVVGETTSDSASPFPTTPSAYQNSLKGPAGNAFVTEIATTKSGASSLVYSSYFGGSTVGPTGDDGVSVALDAAGKVYVTGDAESSDFTVTPGAFQTTNSTNAMAFISKFDLTQSGAASLVYSTLLGGTTSDTAGGIAVDGNGDAFVAGQSQSADFPVTSDAFQSTLKSSGGNAFLAELRPDASALIYGTYLGGSGPLDAATGVALDAYGNSYVTGYTQSADFPTTSGAFQTTAVLNPDTGFVTKFSPNVAPSITTTESPLPNGSGWNSSAVTVTFSCIPGSAPIQSCPSPTTISSDGANQTVSGNVYDTAGNNATTTLTVNLDTTPPSVDITSPASGAAVGSSPVTVSGAVTDSLSGVSGVQCNGVQATFSASTYSCSVQLVSGSNTIQVTATDLAGNSATATITVTLSTGAPVRMPMAPLRLTSETGLTKTATIHRGKAAGVSLLFGGDTSPSDERPATTDKGTCGTGTQDNQKPVDRSSASQDQHEGSACRASAKKTAAHK